MNRTEYNQAPRDLEPSNNDGKKPRHQVSGRREFLAGSLGGIFGIGGKKRNVDLKAPEQDDLDFEAIDRRGSLLLQEVRQSLRGRDPQLVNFDPAKPPREYTEVVDKIRSGIDAVYENPKGRSFLKSVVAGAAVGLATNEILPKSDSSYSGFLTRRKMLGLAGAVAGQFYFAGKRALGKGQLSQAHFVDLAAQLLSTKLKDSPDYADLQSWNYIMDAINKLDGDLTKEFKFQSELEKYGATCYLLFEQKQEQERRRAKR